MRLGLTIFLLVQHITDDTDTKTEVHSLSLSFKPENTFQIKTNGNVQVKPKFEISQAISLLITFKI